MPPRQRQRVPVLNAQCSGYGQHESSSSSVTKGLARKRSTLCGPTEADIARDQHDYFNLVALVFVVISTAMNYDFRGDRLSLESLEKAWTNEHFWLMWGTTVGYFLVDLLWVAMVPICVKSPDVIIKHHIVAVLYLVAPICYPEYRWFMGSILSVEVNTWFLILRRVVFKSQDSHPLVGQFVSISFYLTWIVIRCIIYPAVLIKFLQMATERIAETGSYWHLPMIFIPAHAALCALNMKWTYDLFRPIVKRWLGLDKNKKVMVQSGL